MRKLCEQKGVEIIEAEAYVNHIHMLVSIPLHISMAQFIEYIKGKSMLMIFERHANWKYKCMERWVYDAVNTVGQNKRIIEEYIRNQLEEDCAYEQMIMKEYIRPVCG